MSLDRESVSVSCSLLPSMHIPCMFYPLLLTFTTHATDVASHPLFTIVYRHPMVSRIESSPFLSSLLCTALR